MSIKAVIFDLDGTLLDTLEDIADSMNAALKKRRFPPHAAADYRYLIGEGVVTLARKSMPAAAAQDPAAVEAVAQAMRREYEKRWDAKTRPYDGIAGLLETLRAKGVKTAVLSNKPDDFTKRCVDRFFPGHPFDAVLGEKIGIPKKPDPASALEIARRLAYSPMFFCCVGDSDIDMKTAKAAGMRPVGVLWGFRTAEELSANGAAHLCKKAADLIELIN
ncbi:MAG TPA: HAD family hydrolase [bacterium]|nr:HAD family hydrolase [bacterium]